MAGLEAAAGVDQKSSHLAEVVLSLVSSATKAYGRSRICAVHFGFWSSNAISPENSRAICEFRARWFL